MTAPTPFPVIDHLPAMCRFMRRRMAEEVRAARRSGDAELRALVLADVKSRRELLTYVEGWVLRRGADGRWGYADNRKLWADMDSDLALLGAAVRRLLRRYDSHPRYRIEWEGDTW